MPGFFTPGTPLYNEEGGDILKGPRNLDAAKKLLAQSGYAGQPVTCLVRAGPAASPRRRAMSRRTSSSGSA